MDDGVAVAHRNSSAAAKIWVRSAVYGSATRHGARRDGVDALTVVAGTPPARRDVAAEQTHWIGTDRPHVIDARPGSSGASD